MALASTLVTGMMVSLETSMLPAVWLGRVMEVTEGEETLTLEAVVDAVDVVEAMVVDSLGEEMVVDFSVGEMVEVMVEVVEVGGAGVEAVEGVVDVEVDICQVLIAFKTTGLPFSQDICIYFDCGNNYRPKSYIKFYKINRVCEELQYNHGGPGRCCQLRDGLGFKKGNVCKASLPKYIHDRLLELEIYELNM